MLLRVGTDSACIVWLHFLCLQRLLPCSLEPSHQPLLCLVKHLVGRQPFVAHELRGSARKSQHLRAWVQTIWKSQHLGACTQYVSNSEMQATTPKIQTQNCKCQSQNTELMKIAIATLLYQAQAFLELCWIDFMLGGMFGANLFANMWGFPSGPPSLRTPTPQPPKIY